MALERNPDYRSAAYSVDSAVADQLAQRGRFLPKLRVDGNLTYWNGPFKVSLTQAIAGSSLPPGAPPAALPVRQQWTSSLTLTLTQPLTELWGTWREYQSRKLLRAAALAHLDDSGRALLFQVRSAFLRLLQVQRNAEISQASVTELKAHLDVTKVQVEAEVAVEADFLRAQVQLGQAQQDLSRASANVAQSWASLAVQLGADPAVPLEVIDPFGEGALPQVTGTLEELTAQAIDTRPDLREARLRRESADAEVAVSWSQLIPNVDLQGQYQHLTGEHFVPVNQGYVAGTISWDIFDWGTKYYGARSAEARAAQSFELERSAELRVRSDVARAYQDLHANETALRVARETVTQAEEAFRQETTRYQARVATTVELLDAQTALVQGRLRLSNARFDYLVSVAQLESLVGQPLLWK
jgi:outer membrane protein TolC